MRVGAPTRGSGLGGSLRLPGAGVGGRADGMEDGEPIRVLLGEMPALLRDLVCGLVASEPDMVVVGTEAAVDAIGPLLERMRPEALVVEKGALDAARGAAALLWCRPGMRVVAIQGDGRRGALWVLRPRRVDLGELAPELLLRCIRGAGRQPARRGRRPRQAAGPPEEES